MAFAGVRRICRGTRAVDECRFGNRPSLESECDPVLRLSATCCCLLHCSACSEVVVSYVAAVVVSGQPRALLQECTDPLQHPL